MSLLKSFKEVLSSFGMDEIKKPVFYNSQVAIRFNIGDNGNDTYPDIEDDDFLVNFDYVNTCIERSLKIYHNLNNAPDLLMIEGYLYKDESVDDFISSVVSATGLSQPDEINKEIIYDKDEMYHISLFWNLVDFSPEKLFREIIIAELETGKYFLTSSVYFICTKDNVLFHLYDDRGADLVADTKDKISNIYYELNDLILDDDREKIDEIFKTTAR